MKELSIEEKAKRYDEAIEKAKYYYDEGKTLEYANDIVSDIFPELAESDDEKVRKEILEFFCQFENGELRGVDISSWIAWLEMQGEKGINGKNKEIPFSEQKPNPCGNCGIATNNCQNFPCVIRDGEQKSTDKVEPKFKVGDIIKDTEFGQVFTIRTITKDKYIYTDDSFDWIKDQDEYELVEQNPADKVEPKFREGEWVVSPNGVYWHIDKISNNRYEVTSNIGESSNWPLDTNIYHSFSIQDAKDGDVLVCESGWTCIFKTLVNDETFSSYCFMDKTKWFCETGSECHTLEKEFVKSYNGKIYPATKKQHDLLFQKMKEAGYEWDAEKKELKKIDVRTTGYWHVEDVEQKPAWSEEDNKIIEEIINDIECARAINYHAPKEGYEFRENWLKSLKDRVQPQPKQEWSQNDIDMIDWLIRCCEKEHEELCNDKYGHQDIVSDLKKDCRKKWNWLEKLKNKVVPQSTWKPSDEQMKILNEVLNFAANHESLHWNDYIFGTLNNLIRQLKKLKDEK